ncbi:MAG: hypothetical protein ACR2PO_20555 [Methyloligellaceae bacterium]
MSGSVLKRITLSGLLLALSVSAVAAQARTIVPDLKKIDILIRTTIVALNHANRTGNYTVFRDLGSPNFGNANTAARLAAIFATLRKQNLDLGPVILFNPQLTRQPTLDQQSRLRLTGFFPTRPLQVNFDLAYELIAGQWRLFGIAVNATSPPSAKAAPARKPVKPKAKKKR